MSLLTLLGVGGAVSGGGGDPYFSSVVLLAVNDNAADGTTTFIDQSSYARALTANGNAQYDTAQAPTGMTSSGLFDGTGDFVNSADAADLEPGSSDFTVEFMVRLASVAGSAILVDKRSSAIYAPWAISRVGTALQWYSSSSGAAWDVASGSPIGTVAVDTWYHVALTRSGSTFRAFLDGTKNATEVTSSASLFDNAQGFQIGGQAGFYTDGWIANVRYTIGVARYTANFTPPTLPLPTS